MKKVLGFLLLVVVALVAFIASRPNAFHVERSITIGAPSEVVFAKINDLHQWAAWSPWERLDPQMKRTFGGAESGLGATYDWTGNNQVGEGRMTIMESHPSDKVALKL